VSGRLACESQVAKPDRVILFGSAATGRMTRDSDIDLLVVEPAPANRTVESVRIRRALGDRGYPVDVIVISTCGQGLDREDSALPGSLKHRER
jgi:predicted nucleotidyltransferase